MRIRRTIQLCGLVLLMPTAATALAAQQAAPTTVYQPGRILGVFDDESGLPIADAEVVDLYVNGVARTEAHGLVELSQFQRRNDSAAVRIRKLGFVDTAMVVMVGAADTVPVQVFLHKASVALPTMTVNATVNSPMVRRMAEFEDRRRVGLGQYILADELGKRADRTIAELLADDGFKCHAYSLNGVPHTSPAVAKMALQQQADDFVAVETYSLAAMPPQFGGTGSAQCITILWTRY